MLHVVSQRDIPTLENEFIFISVKNTHFALLQENELVWKFEFHTARIWRLCSFKTWYSVIRKTLPTFLKNLFPHS